MSYTRTFVDTQEYDMPLYNARSLNNYTLRILMPRGKNTATNTYRPIPGYTAYSQYFRTWTKEILTYGNMWWVTTDEDAVYNHDTDFCVNNRFDSVFDTLAETIRSTTNPDSYGGDFGYRTIGTSHTERYDLDRFGYRLPNVPTELDAQYGWAINVPNYIGESGGVGAYRWVAKPVKVELCDAYYYHKYTDISTGSLSHTEVAPVTVYTAATDLTVPNSDYIDITIPESALKGRVEFYPPGGAIDTLYPSPTDNRVYIAELFDDYNLNANFRVTWQYTEYYVASEVGDLWNRNYVARKYSTVATRNRFGMGYGINIKPHRALGLTERTRVLETVYQNDASYNPFNTISFTDSYKVRVRHPFFEGWYKDVTHKPMTYTDYAAADTLGRYMLDTASRDESWGAANERVFVATDEDVQGYWMITTTKGDMFVKYKPKVVASYTLNEETDVATWSYKVDATELAKYASDFNYTIQVVGVESHGNTTTTVFDSTVIPRGQGVYSYTGKVTGIKAHEWTSTLQCNVYLMYHDVQLDISSAYQKTVSGSQYIMYWHGTTNGLGLYCPPQEHQLTTPILNITCNPEHCTGSVGNIDATRDSGYFMSGLHQLPHWQMLGCGWVVNDTASTLPRKSYIQWWGLPHNDCDGKGKFLVVQHYFNEYSPMPVAEKHKNNLPIGIDEVGTMSTPNVNTHIVEGLYELLNDANSVHPTRFNGIRYYYWEDFIKLHPGTGTGHYSIPIYYKGAWTYVDEDDLQPTAT